MRSLLSHLHSYSVKDSLDAEARVAQAKGIEVIDADGDTGQISYQKSYGVTKSL